MAKKHFMIYYKQGTGTFVVTEPRPWARENPHHFPVNHNPTTNFIKRYLINNYDFVVGHNNDGISVIYNLDPNLNL